MSAFIARHCLHCHSYAEIPISASKSIHCPYCEKSWGEGISEDKIFDRCCVCQSRQFYTAKNFNQLLGCLIMLIGIILVPWTYGLSLPLFALLDFFLHKRVPTIVICYKCGTSFHNYPIPSHLKPFMHHIGLKYDKFRDQYK